MHNAGNIYYVTGNTNWHLEALEAAHPKLISASNIKARIELLTRFKPASDWTQIKYFILNLLRMSSNLIQEINNLLNVGVSNHAPAQCNANLAHPTT